MSSHRKYILIIILTFLSVQVFSQRWKFQRFEITAGIGSSNYFGDIGGTADESNLFGLKDIELSYTRPNINIGGRYRLQKDMNIKGNFIFGYLEASDVGSKNEPRNFAFSSSVYELSFQYEYSIIPEETPVNFSIGNLRRGLRSSKASLNTYVFAGIGGTFFNTKPLSDFDGSDRFDGGNNFSLVIPVGIGVKYPINSQIGIGFELGGRWSTSDYLDGFASKYSSHNDIYYFSLLNVVFKMDTKYRRKRFKF
jgi:hypothetical protein